ncbi:DUF4131 domain-containing protein, partial [Streptomyces sp. AA8]
MTPATGTGPPPPEAPPAARDEGPPDLRLIAPALAAWAAAAAALTASGWTVALAAGAGVLAAGALVVGVLGASRGRGGAAGPGGGLPASSSRGPGRGVVVALAAVLLCAVAGAAVAALHGADVRRGPLPGLARRQADVAVEATVTADPRATRPRARGAVHAAPAVVIGAEATKVTAGRVSTAVRTPVLLIAPPSWAGLLPSTRVRAEGRLALPSRAAGSGPPPAAVLRISGREPPAVVAGPDAVQRVAARFRAGLRDATDGLEPDARALLPGLVVGDTSRVPEDLDDAFRATGMTHLLAVSGSNLAILLAVLVGPPHLAARAERRGLAARLGVPLRATAVLGGGLVLGFVVVCRPEPSVLRAAACGLVLLLALATGRRRGLLPALAAAALLLVLY